MRVLWMTWKDRSHPHAGGAELVNEELAKRLVKDGHDVTFLVSGFEGAPKEEKRNRFTIIRMGNRFTVYWKAYRYYKKQKETFDLVIDEMNTIPFFAKFYAKEKSILFVHQLCRKIWFYEMIFPLSLIGYLLEPIYLWLLNDRQVVTVSESTKRDLVRYAFKAQKIHVISEGVDLEPADLAQQKFPAPTILSLGSIRPMKRTHQIVKAFELVRRMIPDARLILAGEAEGRYGKGVIALAKKSIFAKDIQILGKVDAAKKKELLQKSHVLAVTSVKEGWGLVVTEANSQGTLAIVYDVDGLRDSVQNGKTGIVCAKNTPQCLAENIVTLLKDDAMVARLSRSAHEWSKEITFEKSYHQFADILLKR